jgi:amidase
MFPTAILCVIAGNTKETEKQVATDQSLIRETATAIVAKLNAGDVTPLVLLVVLECRFAAVD